MAEYIEREAALNRLCQENCGHDFVEGKCHNCYTGSFLTYIPAADVAPVVHGRWTFYSSYGEDEYEYECSVCNEWANQRYTYCPNCGAHMKDGE